MTGEIYDELPGSIAIEPRQEELLARSCRDIEERIRTAGTLRNARRIADEACRDFDSECESSVMQTYVRKHAENLLHRYWGSEIHITKGS
jgi:hypothetical protein